MKKTITSLIAAAMALIIGISLCACGENNTPAQEKQESRSGAAPRSIQVQEMAEGIELEEVSKDAATIFNNGDAGFGFIFEIPDHPNFVWDKPVRSNVKGIYGANGAYNFYREFDGTLYTIRLFFSQEYTLDEFIELYMKNHPCKTYTIPYGDSEIVFLPEYRDLFVGYQKDGVNYFINFWDIQFARDILEAFGLEVEAMENRISDKIVETVIPDRFGREVPFPKGLYFGDFTGGTHVNYGITMFFEAYLGDTWDNGGTFIVSEKLTAKTDAEDWANLNDLKVSEPAIYRGMEIYRICDLCIFEYQKDGLNFVVEVWNEETLDTWLDFFADELGTLEPAE